MKKFKSFKEKEKMLSSAVDSCFPVYFWTQYLNGWIWNGKKLNLVSDVYDLNIKTVTYLKALGQTDRQNDRFFHFRRHFRKPEVNKKLKIYRVLIETERSIAQTI